MDWVLDRDAQGWSWRISGECSMDDLRRMKDDALRVLAQPAETVVKWTDTEWVHLAFLQVLLSLRKGLAKTGHGVTLTSEAPGFDEDQQGLAFVGKASQLLTKMIEAIGLTRDQVFICNIVKCRPPGNRAPTPDEAANCMPYLMRQLEVLRPRVICALGGTAAKWLLQTHDGITQLRGRFYPYRGAQLMPTFHPAYVLRNYTQDTRKKVYEDLLKVRAAMDAAT